MFNRKIPVNNGQLTILIVIIITLFYNGQNMLNNSPNDVYIDDCIQKGKKKWKYSMNLRLTQLVEY